MPRRETIGDIEALLAAHANYSGGVPLSVVARRAQVVANRMHTAAGAQHATEVFQAAKLDVRMPAEWNARKNAVAKFAAIDLPLLVNTINNTGLVDRFPPHLLPAALLDSASRWAAGTGGAHPATLAAEVRKQAAKITARNAAPPTPMHKPVFLRAADGSLLSLGRALLNARELHPA